MDLIACYDSLEALSRHNPAPERERESFSFLFPGCRSVHI